MALPPRCGPAAVPLLVEFASRSRVHCQRHRASDLPIIGNGPPGTFVILPDGAAISLPTDQVVCADDEGAGARVGFGGMRFDGIQGERLTFTRVRDLHPEEQLSPDRSRVMTLEPRFVAAVHANGIRVWPEAVANPVATDS